MYRVDIVKNGQRWSDDVGVSATSDEIASAAVSLLAEAALETSPLPGLKCIAEVHDQTGRQVMKAELALSL